MQHSNTGSHLFSAANRGKPHPIGPLARIPGHRSLDTSAGSAMAALCSHQQTGHHRPEAADPESKLRHERVDV
jgi:hypothetical protein